MDSPAAAFTFHPIGTIHSPYEATRDVPGEITVNETGLARPKAQEFDHVRKRHRIVDCGS